MAELADALALGASVRKDVGVRVPPLAQRLLSSEVVFGGPGRQFANGLLTDGIVVPLLAIPFGLRATYFSQRQ